MYLIYHMNFDYSQFFLLSAMNEKVKIIKEISATKPHAAILKVLPALTSVEEGSCGIFLLVAVIVMPSVSSLDITN